MAEQHEVMLRLGAPTCPKCKQIATLHDAEWRWSEQIPITLCSECIAAFEELDEELNELDKLLTLSDSVSELTESMEPLPSPTFEAWATTGSVEIMEETSETPRKCPCGGTVQRWEAAVVCKSCGTVYAMYLSPQTRSPAKYHPDPESIRVSSVPPAL